MHKVLVPKKHCAQLDPDTSGTLEKYVSVDTTSPSLLTFMNENLAFKCLRKGNWTCTVAILVVHSKVRLMTLIGR